MLNNYEGYETANSKLLISVNWGGSIASPNARDDISRIYAINRTVFEPGQGHGYITMYCYIYISYVNIARPSSYNKTCVGFYIISYIDRK